MQFGDASNTVVKFGIIAVMLLYLVFAVMVVRQINLMVRTFNTPFERNIKLIGWIHLGAAVGVLVLALVL